MHQVDVFESLADAAYQGAPGAYSEEAAQALLGAEARLLPCATIEQTFDAVTDGRVTHAVVPVDSALSGTVPSVYDLLLSHDLVVAGERLINIDHVLVAPRGARVETLRRVLSHPVALAQCSDFFRTHPAIEAVSVFDTAGAVRLALSAPDRLSGAIASRRAAALYNAEIVAEHVQDDRENWTRFLLLTRRVPAQGHEQVHKAFIAFDLPHAPGALVKSLQPIAAHGLNVTKIEGRPIRGKAFEYRFVVEIAAPDGATISPAVFHDMTSVTAWLKVLGAF
jgi:prephenate dehydratase